MPLPPSLSPEQRQAALEKAAAARRERAELKEKLKMGSINLKELLRLADSQDVVAKMKVTCGGGSSSVLSSALNAAVDSMCTSSMM
jgi:hypothetical protein